MCVRAMCVRTPRESERSDVWRRSWSECKNSRATSTVAGVVARRTFWDISAAMLAMKISASRHPPVVSAGGGVAAATVSAVVAALSLDLDDDGREARGGAAATATAAAHGVGWRRCASATHAANSANLRQRIIPEIRTFARCTMLLSSSSHCVIAVHSVMLLVV